MSNLLYRLWEQFVSNEESCVKSHELNDPYTRIGKWWPLNYPESEATEIVSAKEWRKLKAGAARLME